VSTYRILRLVIDQDGAQSGVDGLQRIALQKKGFNGGLLRISLV